MYDRAEGLKVKVKRWRQTGVDQLKKTSVNWMLVAVGARAVGDEEAGIQTQSTQSSAFWSN